MPMPKESFQGDRLRERVKGYNVPLEGLSDVEICRKVYDVLKSEDILNALEFKYMEGWDKWSKEQWNEALKIVGYEEGWKIPLVRRMYFEKVDDIVREIYPQLVGNYDASFVACIIDKTHGEDEKIRMSLEQLAVFHKGHEKNLSVGYTGDMLNFVYQSGIIK